MKKFWLVAFAAVALAVCIAALVVLAGGGTTTPTTVTPAAPLPEGKIPVNGEDLSKPAAPLPEGKIIVKAEGGLLIGDCDNKSYITETADYIIEGTIEKVESKRNEDGTSIFTYADMRIENYAKGAPFTEDKLQIVTPGGMVGAIGEWVEGSPSFHEGEKVRIYFNQANGEFSIVCAPVGVEEI
ncbi:MAG: hypothetical protein V1676_03030 [Candidatus Diapherotrites archaeon]